MKEIIYCLGSFLLAIAIAVHLPTKKTALEFNKDELSLMECFSLSEDNFSIESDSMRFRALSECSFGGYMPIGPTTRL